MDSSPYCPVDQSPDMAQSYRVYGIAVYLAGTDLNPVLQAIYLLHLLINMKHQASHTTQQNNIDSTPPVRWFLIITFLVIIFTVPVCRIVYHLRNDGRTPCPLQGLSLSSDTLKDLEKRIENDSPVRALLLPHLQSLLTDCTATGNARVCIGRHGQLFLTDSLDHLAGRPFLDEDVIRGKRLNNELIEPNPVPAITRLAEDLSSMGIKLILLPVPEKPGVCPEEFSRRFEATAEILHNPSFVSFVDHITMAQVFLPSWDQQIDPVFLEYDTHWTPAAMEHVAEQLAKLIESSGINLSRREEGKYTRHERKVTHIGDLARMLNLPDTGQQAMSQTVTIHPVTRSDGKPLSEKCPAEILLLGDSFSNIYSGSDLNWGEQAGLAEQLGYYLQRPVRSMIQNGNGAYASREQLLRTMVDAGNGKSGNTGLAGIKVVIYQFSERELSTGDWKILPLPVVGNSTDREIDRSDPKAISVQGTVNMITPVPEPGSVPYDDILACMHLKQIRPELAGGESECLVFAWGMRERKLMRAANFKPGQDLQATLVKWGEAPQKIRRVLKLRLTDPDLELIDLPVYWLVE